ncbi:MAG TPA: sigma-70 family RNA polymerase sigma factor [Polyangiaceae bacterium]|nr:sigma-70 family RNA polymerase sigma factor [Polyangiaceae bacterium]
MTGHALGAFDDFSFVGREGQAMNAMLSEPTIFSSVVASGRGFRVEFEYVQRTLRRLGTEQSEVDDLAQEVFLVMHRRWAEFDQSRPLRPYLFGVAVRIALANQRKRAREVAFGNIELGDDRPGPEEVLSNKQTRALVQVALNRIPLPRRTVLVMHELDRVPVTEVAATLAIPLFTVYSRLRKAREELKFETQRILNGKHARRELGCA